MTKTPRTDSVTFKAEFGMMPICDTVPAVFARTLERELNEACDVLNFRRELYALQTEQLDKVRGELAKAREQRDKLEEALREIKNELGVPQPEYPAPVANAVKTTDEALQSLTTNEQ